MANLESASANVRQWRIAPPAKHAGIKPEIRYAPSIDSLFVYITDPTRPYVGMVLGDHFTALLDPQTDELLGFEIGHFLAESVMAHPILEPLLATPGLPAFKVWLLRKKLDRKGRTQDVVQSLIDYVTGQYRPDGNGLRPAFR